MAVTETHFGRKQCNNPGTSSYQVPRVSKEVLWDRGALRQKFPEGHWYSLEEWARLQDWETLLAPAA